MRGGRRILTNLSLTIEEGEHVAILGPNGSGKSTLIKLITRMLYPLTGTDQNPIVRIFGRDRWDVFELRSMLGILSNDQQQDFTSDDSLRGMETVLSGFFASQGVPGHRVVTAKMREAAEHALQVAHASTLSQKLMAEMSTGEARRILIARALVSDPRALMLDEPTAGLDIASRRQFLHAVRRISGMGKSLILVTHHVEEIIPEIGRVILMKDGAIFFDGPKKEVLTSMSLSDLFETPIDLRKTGGYYSAEVELLSSDRISHLD